MRKIFLHATLAGGVLLPFAAGAAPLAYDYVEASAAYDLLSGDHNPRGAGLELGGALSFADNFYVSGHYSDVNLDKGVPNLKRGSLDAGYDNKINDSLLGYAQISYENLDVRRNDSGLGIEGGLRYAVSDQFEASGGIEFINIPNSKRTDSFSFEEQPGLKLGAGYDVSPAIAVVGRYEYLKDDSSIRLGLRYSFDS